MKKILRILLLFVMIFNCFSFDVGYRCMDYDRQRSCAGVPMFPVCGWFDASVTCFAYPCAARFSSICTACSVDSVEKITQGRCPLIEIK